MVKKTLFLGAAALLLVVLFFGRGAVSYVTTAVDRVQDQVKGNVPIKFEIDRARGMIKNLEPEVERNMHLIAREEVEVPVVVEVRRKHLAVVLRRLRASGHHTVELPRRHTNHVEDAGSIYDDLGRPIRVEVRDDDRLSN